LLIDGGTQRAGRVAAEPKQRWRLTFRRGPASTDASSSGLDAWVTCIEASELPAAAAGARPKVSLAAPLPLDMAGERELLDLYLTDRRPLAEVRRAIEPRLPAGHDIVDLHDVWVGEAPLPAQVAAADYRVVLVANDLDAAAVEGAADRLLAMATIPRTRAKGDRSVNYDLRPLLAELAVADPGPPVVIRIRTRFDPAKGAGRPDEVVAALSEVLGATLATSSVTRERIWLASELAAG
jgi:radical SAM-linked protein